jgi:hypothetical protein
VVITTQSIVIAYDATGLWPVFLVLMQSKCQVGQFPVLLLDVEDVREEVQ